jgi:hypothetical protein
MSKKHKMAHPESTRIMFSIKDIENAYKEVKSGSFVVESNHNKRNKSNYSESEFNEAWRQAKGKTLEHV